MAMRPTLRRRIRLKHGFLLSTRPIVARPNFHMSRCLASSSSQATKQLPWKSLTVLITFLSAGVAVGYHLRNKIYRAFNGNLLDDGNIRAAPLPPATDWQPISLDIDRHPKSMLNLVIDKPAGLAIRSVLWSPTRQELVMNIEFGLRMSGWPGIAHGGIVATVMIEAVRQALNRANQPETPELALVDLSYLRPALIGLNPGGHTIRVRIDPVQPEESQTQSTWAVPWSLLSALSILPPTKPFRNYQGEVEMVDLKDKVCARARWSGRVGQ